MITSRMQQLIQPMNVFSPADSSCTVICISTISHLQTVGKGDVFIILEVSTVIKVSHFSLNCGFKWPSLKQFTINPSNSKVPDFHSQQQAQINPHSLTASFMFKSKYSSNLILSINLEGDGDEGQPASSKIDLRFCLFKNNQRKIPC